MKHLIRTAVVCSVLALMGCNVKNPQAIQAEAEAQSKHVIATVNGETLTEGELERTEAWLPAFARQLESNSNIQMQRFWSLVQIMSIAQDAKSNGLLSDAERSLAIKEALAAEAILQISYPPKTFTEEEIATYQKKHPDEFFEPPAFTVNYALVKRESTIHTLTAAFGLASGAQMGYNYMDPPERVASYTEAGGPLMYNDQGHSMNAQKFNFAFTTWNTENKDEFAQLGPFTASDNLLFSCDKAIEILKTAPLNRPITQDLACSGDWKAFFIPEYRRDAAPMNAEKARQVAIEKLTAEYRAQYLEEYVKSL